MKELTLAAYKENPTEIRDRREKRWKPWGGLENLKDRELSILFMTGRYQMGYEC
jgi:hypothetical protein